LGWAVVAVDVRSQQDLLQLADLSGTRAASSHLTPREPKAFVEALADRVKLAARRGPRDHRHSGIGVVVPGMVNDRDAGAARADIGGATSISATARCGHGLTCRWRTRTAGVLAQAWAIRDASGRATWCSSRLRRPGRGRDDSREILRGTHNIAGEFGHCRCRWMAAVLLRVDRLLEAHASNRATLTRISDAR
jgi:predicted NBD/HSP70 family sugar kinase